MKQKKLPLFLIVIVALFSAGYSSVTPAAEKLTCDVMDAPNVDLTTITEDLQTRIGTLTQLQNDLKETQAELKSDATIESLLVDAKNFASLLKAASAITLSVAGAVATGPEALATTIVSTTAGFITDAINNSGNKQEDVILESAKSYGAANIDLITGQLLDLAKTKAFSAGWKTFSTQYTMIVSIIDASNTWTSANLKSQIKAFDKQLNTLNTQIRTLKVNLAKMQKLVGGNEKKLDKGFPI